MLMASNPLRLKVLAAAMAAVMVSGCASMSSVRDTIDESQKEADASLSQLDKLKRSGAIVRNTGAKLAGAPVPVNNVEALPAVFDERFAYLAVGERISTQLSEISRRTKIKINIQPALKAELDKETKPASLEWSGTLRGLLDYIAANRDVFWRYENGAVQFFKTDTRVFNIYLPAGKREVSSSISLAGTGGGGGSGGGGGDGTVSVSGSSTIDSYEAITKTITLMVTDGGTDASKAVIPNPTLGSITVTATPAVLDRIDRYVTSVNERFSQNVLINVRVLNLTLNKNVTAGAQADLVYRSLTKNLDAELLTPEILQPARTAPGSLIISGTDGRTSGQTILQALEEVGKVSVVTSGQVVAANGQPSPFQAANDITYVSGSTTSQAANVGQTTTIETETLTVGFTANFLPLILGDNRIMLQYQLNLSSLLSLDQVATAGTVIQTPNISKQTLQQQAFLRDGESIVLFGYEQERASQNLRRFFPGISKASGSDRTMMVIILEVYGGK